MNDTVERLHNVEERAGRSRPLWPFAIVVLILGCLGFQAWRAGSAFGRALAILTSAPTPVSAPSTSWQEMYGLAQREATKIDSQAVLSGVEAWSPASSPFGGYKNWDQISPNTALGLTFIFSRSVGGSIFIDMDDTAPTSTLGVDVHDLGKVTPVTPTQAEVRDMAAAQQRLTKIASGLVEVQISPRQAIAATWDAAVSYGRQMQQFIHVVADPSVAFALESNQPVWSVSYTMIDPTRPTRARWESPIAVDEVKATFLVDATTGKILKADPTPTRTP